ncbi:MAG: RecX family transcriptional regulator [Stellaceae bacterium]
MADEIGPDLLERWALSYLERYASSAENLRRVLLRRARRHYAGDRERLAAVAAAIDVLLARYGAAELIDDAAYAAGRALSLQRRGHSRRAIRARLAQKGVAPAVAAEALAALADSGAEPDLAAACAFARRRRLGPYRRGPADPVRELAAFARAGFTRPVAEAVLACPDEEAAETLARGG